MLALVGLTLFVCACSNPEGEVTSTEYERAAVAHVRCLQDAGVETNGPDLEDDGSYSYATRDPDPADTEAHSQAITSCAAEHLAAAEASFAESQAPTQDESAAYYEAVVDCVGSGGIEATDSSSASLTDLSREFPAEFNDCLMKVAEETRD